MLKPKNIFYCFVFLLIIFTACKKSGDQPETIITTIKAEELLNVSYGSNARNVLDIYFPEVRDKNTPVIILIHGGSWFEGDKNDLTTLAKYWRDKGFAAATINYRLTHTTENNIHPAQVNDIGKAIDFIGSKADEWHINSSIFALQGASAGAHLALLFSYKYDTNKKVKAVISMAGPTVLNTDLMASPLQVQVVNWLIGSTIQTNPTAYAEASPITYVSSRSAPTLIFHGKQDMVVPYQQSEDLFKRLLQFGVERKLVLYPDTGHELLSLNNTSSFLKDCEDWFKLYLK